MDKLFNCTRTGNSGPEHWQTYFQNSHDDFYRIEQKEWDSSTCKEWIETIDMGRRNDNIKNAWLTKCTCYQHCVYASVTAISNSYVKSVRMINNQ